MSTLTYWAAWLSKKFCKAPFLTVVFALNFEKILQYVPKAV